MKVLICLSVVLALANAGHLAHNRVVSSVAYNTGSLGSPVFYSSGNQLNSGVAYGNGFYNGGIYKTISAPATYAVQVQQAPAVHVIKQQPTVFHQTYAAPISSAQIIHPQQEIIQAPIYGSSPILSSAIVSKPVLAQSYGLSYAPSSYGTYGTYGSYGIGAGFNKVINKGILKRQ